MKRGLAHLLDVVEPHAQIKDTNAPALVTVRRNSGTTIKGNAISSLVILVLVHCQMPSCLVLHNDVASPVTSPVGEMDAVSRPRNRQFNLGVVSPRGRGVSVDVDLSSMAILVDPDIIIAASTTHIAVVVTVCLELRSSSTLILPDHYIEVVLFFFEEDVVKTVRAVDASELDAVLDS